eukprot:TRINITY_DN4672_c0_g1_i1.p1 TRINITY_DN4672_c0_g1~~TRINITY_DN4672_c0_g1_i1.p1  ORF type:complete len:158 (-),score=20.16 TRINITY_DN4672_c0_g1_i1:162-614(-)
MTGAADGCIRLWDLSSKPSAPVRQYMHKDAVTGLAMLDAFTLASSSQDGSVQLWDIRQGTSAPPIRTMVPDGKPVVAMAASPLRDALAVSTLKGLYCLELAGTSGALLKPLTPLPPCGPCLELKWNDVTQEIYVCGTDGTLTVYSKSQAK